MNHNHRDIFKRKKSRVWLLIPLIIAGGLMFFSYQYWSKQSGTQPTQEINNPAPNNQPAVYQARVTAMNNVATTINATLKSLAFKWEDKTGLLVFSFDQATHYQVEPSQDNSQLILMFTNTTLSDKLQQDLPTLPQNSWVRSLQFQQSQNNLIAKINLSPDVQLQNLHLISEPKPRVYIQLFHPQATSVPIKALIEKTVVSQNLQQNEEQQYQVALNLIAKQQIPAAIAKLQALVKQDPNYNAARETLITLLIQTNQPDQANSLLVDGLIQNPDNMRLVKLRVQILANSDKIPAALTILQQHNPQMATDPSYYKLMAALYQKQGNYSLAVTLYRRLLNLQPKNGTLWASLGFALEAAGNKTQAQDAYRHALQYSANLNQNIRSYLQNKVG